ITGGLIDEGNANNVFDININNSAAAGYDGCPTGVGGCDIETDSAGASTGHKIIQVVNSGLITQVIDPAGNLYNLGFSSNYLTTVTNVSHSNATTYFSYYTGNASPYNAQIHTIEDPNTNITTIGYNSVGMASDESDPLNH